MPAVRNADRLTLKHACLDAGAQLEPLLPWSPDSLCEIEEVRALCMCVFARAGVSVCACVCVCVHVCVLVFVCARVH